jgi:hypothetical protein
MKRLYACLLSVMLCVVVNADTTSISFTSLKIPAGTYEPERDVIVYVVDSSGAFVRTIATWGDDLDDDIPWNAISSGSKVDAVSGATIKGNDAQSLKTSWDGKDENKTNVTKGSYWLIISANSRDRNASPSRLKIKLDVGGPAKTITSADSSFSNGTGCLTDLSVVFTAGSNKIRNHMNYANYKTIQSGKIPLYLSGKNENFTVSLFSLSGKCIFRQLLSIPEDDKGLSLPVQQLPDGTYLYLITTETNCISSKIVLKRR